MSVELSAEREKTQKENSKSKAGSARERRAQKSAQYYWKENIFREVPITTRRKNKIKHAKLILHHNIHPWETKLFFARDRKRRREGGCV